MSATKKNYPSFLYLLLSRIKRIRCVQNRQPQGCGCRVYMDVFTACPERSESFSLVLLITLFSTLLFTSMPSQATIYKWIDKTGEVHYSGEPATGNQTTEIVKIRQHTTTRPRISKEDRERERINQQQTDAERKKREALQPRPVVKKMPAGEKRRLCRQAGSDIASITSHGRMREINARGEYHYLSEKQRQQRLTAARKKQQNFCR